MNPLIIIGAIVAVLIVLIIGIVGFVMLKGGDANSNSNSNNSLLNGSDSPTPAGTGSLSSFTRKIKTGITGENIECKSGFAEPKDCAQSCLDTAGCLSFDYARPEVGTNGYCCTQATKTGAVDNVDYDHYALI